jgi:glyoxylase-like metal-dependent hydrolase (beta-lactamase superfamily II)/8-oxo-dGTP pyrophosphatase MutT (NUDIX family)
VTAAPTPPAAATPLPPRPAATLILLRAGAAGLETLMLQRTQSAAFLGGAHVFPGGSLDAADAAPHRVLGLSEAQANERLDLASGGLAYYVAAVRECFEEAGVLLACDARGHPVLPSRAEQLMAQRASPFLELLERENLYIPAGALAYYGHWITQPGRSRRFDTRFFVTLAPQGQEGAHDATETVHHVWITPRQALERAERGEIELVHATRQTLADFARFAEPRAAYEYAMSLIEIPTNRACLAQGREGARIFRHGDAPYFEIHWSDPEESGQTSYDLVPGLAKRLDRHVTRLIAPNPGMMTGPGTNTYLIGGDELAVIDPGPAIDSHIERILAAGPIKWILCTHTHLDHSPAAAAIKQATGAKIFGRPAPAGQDPTFAPDQILNDGARVRLGSVSLRAIHTPGHASNHLCYLLEETRMLFTGDHVMQGSTVIINPPDGDMRAYLASLERLLAEDVAILAPGHGYLIGEPQHELRRLVQHRLKRESKVREAIGKLGAPTLEEMLPLVYDDVPPRVHGIAARSLTAHLQKLVADGAVRERGGRYSLAA